eukprot:287033_1
MYNELRLYVDSVLSRTVVWTLHTLEPHLLSLVPGSETEQKQNDHQDKTKNAKVDDKQSPKHATPEMYSYLARYATEPTLIRGITGSDYRLDVAKDALLETVEWRVTSKVDSITPQMFKDCINSKLVYSFNKRDKKGHLICYFKVPQTPPEDPWELVRAAVWSVEKGVKMAEQLGLYQIMWMIDIENLKYATVPPFQVLKEIAHILHHYFPERMYRAYVLFSPWVFRAVWKIISTLLTDNTKGKIIVPGWHESAQYDTFKENIDKCNLDKRFGGDLEMQYTYEWEAEQYHKTNNFTE